MNYGAIFDMDGLLFDTEQVFQKNWTAIADEMGIELDPAFRRTICGTNGALMNSIIERFYHVEDGQPIQEDVYNRVHRDLENSVPEKPGLREILQFFRDKGYKIAVASSSTKEQISRTDSEIRDISQEQKRLIQRRDSLGIFSGREKKRIDEELARLEQQKRKVTATRTRLEEKLCGYGTKEKLEKLIADNNAGDYIFLMGGCNTLEKEIPKGEVYAYSSDYEGMPNSLLEAMAMGMPVVATDCPCGGPRAVIRDGENGLLVPIKDEDALANGINRLIEDKEFAKRLGKEAAKIKETASTDAVFEQWRDYLEKIVEKTKK